MNLQYSMALKHVNGRRLTGAGAQVDKARSAAELLQRCLSLLQEAADGEEVRRSLDIDLGMNPALEAECESAGAVQRALEQVSPKTQNPVSQLRCARCWAGQP